MTEEERARQEDELTALMEAYQGGDMGAFESLYAALAPMLLAYLRSLARDPVLADDLLQDTFLQLHRARRTYRPGHPVKPWVFAIARNVFLMNRRAAGRRGRREVLADDELPEIPVPAEEGAVIDRDALAKAVRLLGRERCEEMLLHHVAGLSFKEVGHVLGISEGAAKVRSHRALQELKRHFGAAGGGG
jgi:RNA polymerase sigma-70 factor (ECF subfamily)